MKDLERVNLIFFQREMTKKYVYKTPCNHTTILSPNHEGFLHLHLVHSYVFNTLSPLFLIGVQRINHIILIYSFLWLSFIQFALRQNCVRFFTTKTFYGIISANYAFFPSFLRPCLVI